MTNNEVVVMDELEERLGVKGLQPHQLKTLADYNAYLVMDAKATKLSPNSRNGGYGRFTWRYHNGLSIDDCYHGRLRSDARSMDAIHEECKFIMRHYNMTRK